MKKQYNTSEYRHDKRLVAFVKPDVKKKVESQARRESRSVSAIVSNILEAYFAR
jgi:hypothetical protein